jgi:uridine phosphorylase
MKELNTFREFLNEGSTFEITPEYLFDAAIKYIQDDYDGASLHVAPDGSTDDFYDGDKHTFTIKSKEQAEDIINNFENQTAKAGEMNHIEKANVFVREEEELEENDKVLDEVSKAESNVYALLKEIKMEIDKVLNEEGKAQALDAVDMSIDYLKSLEHRIITRG